MRVKKTDVQDAVVAYQRTAAALFGYTPELQLCTGSKVDGVTWKLYELKRDDGTYTTTPPGVPDVHLGFTAGEALDKLRTITGALSSASHHLNK